MHDTYKGNVILQLYMYRDPLWRIDVFASNKGVHIWNFLRNGNFIKFTHDFDVSPSPAW